MPVGNVNEESARDQKVVRTVYLEIARCAHKDFYSAFKVEDVVEHVIIWGKEVVLAKWGLKNSSSVAYSCLQRTIRPKVSQHH